LHPEFFVLKLVSTSARREVIRKQNKNILREKDIIMQNKHDDQILDNLAELSDTEIEELLGAGNGVWLSWTHECHMNSWQVLFTCCS
jgi:ruminococcin-A